MKKETGFLCRLQAAVPARNIIMGSFNSPSQQVTPSAAVQAAFY